MTEKVTVSIDYMNKNKNWTNWRIGGFGIMLFAFCVVAVLAGRATATLAFRGTDDLPSVSDTQVNGSGQITSAPVSSLIDCLELTDLQFALIGRQQVMLEILR